jgi:hypothetical protein
MSNQTTIILPIELRQRAGVLRMNISEVCRDAVLKQVLKEERERGIRRQASTPLQSNPDDLSRMELHNEIGISK